MTLNCPAEHIPQAGRGLCEFLALLIRDKGRPDNAFDRRCLRLKAIKIEQAKIIRLVLPKKKDDFEPISLFLYVHVVGSPN